MRLGRMISRGRSDVSLAGWRKHRIVGAACRRANARRVAWRTHKSLSKLCVELGMVTTPKTMLS